MVVRWVRVRQWCNESESTAIFASPGVSDTWFAPHQRRRGQLTSGSVSKARGIGIGESLRTGGGVSRQTAGTATDHARQRIAGAVSPVACGEQGDIARSAHRCCSGGNECFSQTGDRENQSCMHTHMLST